MRLPLNISYSDIRPLSAWDASANISGGRTKCRVVAELRRILIVRQCENIQDERLHERCSRSLRLPGGATLPTQSSTAWCALIGSGVSGTSSVHDRMACLKRRLPSRRRIRFPAAPSPPRTWGPHRPRIYPRSPYNSRIATICPARRRAALPSREGFLLLRGRVHGFTLHVNVCGCSRRLFNYNISCA